MLNPNYTMPNAQRYSDYLSAYNNLQTLAIMQNYAKLHGSTMCSTAPSNNAQLQNDLAQSILQSEPSRNDDLSSHAPEINSIPSTTSPVRYDLSNPQSGQTTPAASEINNSNPSAAASTSVNDGESIIINTALSFIKSQMLRYDQKTVIENTSTNFTLEEIMDARKSLYRATSCKKYTYRPPADPATTQAKANHCVASIVSKITQLEKAAVKFKIACDAEDVFRLANLYNKTNTNSSTNDHENRISALEMKMKLLEQKSHPTAYHQRDQNSQPTAYHPPVTSFPPIPQIPRGNRSYADMANKTPKPSTPVNAKRRRTAEQDKDNWTTVNGRNRQNHRSNSFFEGKNENNVASNELRGAEIHEVFLFNYANNATEEAVKFHFENNGVSVISVVQMSRPEYEIKSYKMRIKVKEDFDKIIKCLPYKTRARWFIKSRQRFTDGYPFANHWNRQFTPRSPSVFTPTHQIARSPARSESSPHQPNTRSDNAEMDTEQLQGEPNLVSIGIRPIVSPNGTTHQVPKFQVGGPISMPGSVQDSNEVTETLLDNQDG